MNDVDVIEVAKRYRRTASGRPRSLRNIDEWRGSGERWALSDVSFGVGRGETIALIGANGGGKSTLLRLLSGITAPTRGRVVVRRQVAALLTLGEGFHPLLSGTENAITGGMLAGLTAAEARSRVDSIAGFAGLEEHMDQPLRTYSDGMRMRLAFSVAIHIDPELLLIDELLAVGDLRFRQRCLAHLRELKASGVTIVLASHDLAQVRDLCERAIWLDAGRVREIGSSATVAHLYEEAMQATLSPDVAVQQTGSRLGTREIEVTGVRLLDAGGRETNRLLPGARVSVEIDYVAHRDVHEAIFGVSLRREEGGAVCFDLSTESAGSTVAPLGERGCVRLDIDRLDVGGGCYQLAVGIYEKSWAYPYDYVWQALPLEVVAPGTNVGFTPPHRWSVR
jgi:lipopolysaccharide transport system ATP-binding protein